MEYKNNESLMNAIRKDVGIVIGKVSDYALSEVQNSVIENVYDVYEPLEYERLYDTVRSESFWGSWVNKKIEDTNSIISYSVYSDPELMGYNPDKYQHGNEETDKRSELDAMIEESYGYDFLNKGEFPRDYWNPVIEQIDDDTFDFKTIQVLKGLSIQFRSS